MMRICPGSEAWRDPMNRACVSFAPLVLVLLVGGSSAQDAGARAASPWVAEKVKAVVAADNPWSAAAAFHELFAVAGANGLAALREFPHDSIAIQAAWEEVARTLPKTVDKSDLSLRPDLRKLSWFIGFLEG